MRSAAAAQERQRVQNPAHGRIIAANATTSGATATSNEIENDDPMVHNDQTIDIIDLVRFADEVASRHAADRDFLLAAWQIAGGWRARAQQLVEVVDHLRR